MEKIKITALGGLDEEGKDLYCIEVNGDLFVVNGGFKYPDKNAPGIDFIIANTSYLEENKDRVKAYILTKTKCQNFGAVPYVYKKAPAPIYCTIFTKDALIDFSKQIQQDNNYDFHVINVPSSFNIAGHIFDVFGTCSSVVGTFGFSLRTSLGNVVYSGDFIVEYSNEKYFSLDLNTLGKIAEYPTLVLMTDSVNATKPGYCSPSHKILPILSDFFKQANSRIFVALNSDNLYNFNEFFTIAELTDKKVCFYNEMAKNIFLKYRDVFCGGRFNPRNIIEAEDVLRSKASDVVILISEDGEKLYDEISLLINQESKVKQIKILPTDMFIMACPPSDKNEVVFTSTIDDLYKCGCDVRYISRKSLSKIHAFEEDLKMISSLLKPKYYMPIEGYYVDLLANAKLAFNMHIGLSHTNIFLLDNGQSLVIDDHGATFDSNNDDKIKVGDVMIDGIGVGDVVKDIISDRTRLSEDGVVILGCAVSKKQKKIICGPDIQMRGFLFLKDKEADVLIKEITKIFIDGVNNWISSTSNFNNKIPEAQITQQISRLLLRGNNRNPVIRPNIIVLD